MATPRHHSFPSLVKLASRLAAATALVLGITSCWSPPQSAQRPAPASSPSPNSDEVALAQFQKVVRPILEQRCYACHGDGESRAGLAFDTLKTKDQLLHQPELWLKVLNKTRSHVMPPEGHAPPTPAEQLALEGWIKTAGFGLDSQVSDPGRVTVHRLNRTEYHNTIRDLLGVDFDTEAGLAPDDIGHGFDNIADVLNVSPLLMEKYLTAAQSIIAQAVPTESRVMPVLTVPGADFKDATGNPGGKMSYYTANSVSHTFTITTEGDYNVVLEHRINSNFGYVNASSTVTILVDGEKKHEEVYPWRGTNASTELLAPINLSISVHWAPGPHTVAFTMQPLVAAPVASGRRGGNGTSSNTISISMLSAQLQGPMDPSHWNPPANYSRFFPRATTPTDAAGRRDYARELLGPFATKAFRRPVPADTLDNLVNLAEKTFNTPGKTFEFGVAQAMAAVLVSPRFLFRVESSGPAAPGQSSAPIDELALASRLSYFLWSTLPDDELLKLAATGRLRANLSTQMQRMLADPRAAEFAKNFTGQWLQTRAMSTIPINEPVVMAREGVTTKDEVTPAQRQALEEEPAAYFAYVARNNRSVLEFLDSNYTFLNETLAAYYQIAPDVKGPELRQVMLPAGDLRGGMLTMGSVLMVTSNPTRTSPVKRGKWVLDNILGTPPAAPPPNIPSLDDTAKKIEDHVPSLREVLAAHRASPLCASCHDQMDPLGLALDNFNALGWWRDHEKNQPIDVSGQLFTGEKFQDVSEIKRLLATNHRLEFYRTLTEKLLTYAVGRGMEYYDVPTVDQIVARLDKDQGRFLTLLTGVIESAPFQQARLAGPASSTLTAQSAPATAPLALNPPLP